MNFLSIDLEFNQPSGKIIQVGICVGCEDQIGPLFSRQWLIQIDEPISAFITELTGIDDALIGRDGVSLAHCAKELEAIVLQHNVRANPITWGGGDSHELLKAFAQQQIDFPHFGRRWIDVKTICNYLEMSRRADMKPLKGGLKSVMAKYKLKFEGSAHRADVDALNTLRLFFAVLKRQKMLENAAQLLKNT